MRGLRCGILVTLFFLLCFPCFILCSFSSFFLQISKTMQRHLFLSEGTTDCFSFFFLKMSRPFFKLLSLVVVVVVCGAMVSQACMNDSDCEASAPHCTEGGVCVQCLVDADCAANASAPVCVEGTCSARTCTADTDCPENTPVCDLVGGSALYGTCVECTAAHHCNNVAPRCARDRVCRGCTHDADCLYTHENNTHCDTNASSPTHGQCCLPNLAVSLLPFPLFVLLSFLLLMM